MIGPVGWQVHHPISWWRVMLHGAVLFRINLNGRIFARLVIHSFGLSSFQWCINPDSDFDALKLGKYLSGKACSWILLPDCLLGDLPIGCNLSKWDLIIVKWLITWFFSRALNISFRAKRIRNVGRKSCSLGTQPSIMCGTATFIPQKWSSGSGSQQFFSHTSFVSWNYWFLAVFIRCIRLRSSWSIKIYPSVRWLWGIEQ